MKDAANAMDKIPAVAVRKIEGTGLAITLCGITVTWGFGLGNPASLAAPMLILSIGAGGAFFQKTASLLFFNRRRRGNYGLSLRYRNCRLGRFFNIFLNN